MFIKIAILVEWLRIFNPTGDRNIFFWASHALIWIIVIFYGVSLIIVNLACRPYHKNWDLFTPGRCYDTIPIYIASAVINLVVDISIFILPQKVIWSLQMSTKRRLGVAAVFAVGILYVDLAASYGIFVTDCCNLGLLYRLAFGLPLRSNLYSQPTYSITSATLGSGYR